MCSRMRLKALAFALVFALLAASNAVAETFDNPQGNFNWKIYDYNASGQALRVRQPLVNIGGGDGGMAFNFLHTPDTALFMTGWPGYRGDRLGDLRGKTVTRTRGDYRHGGFPPYTYFGRPSCGDVPANLRFFFQTRPSGAFNPSDYW